MLERQLVHQFERRTTKNRNLAARLQPATSAQFVGLLAAGRICTETSGDAGMRKASTGLLEQGTQTPSPAPDLIPAEIQINRGLTSGLIVTSSRVAGLRYFEIIKEKLKERGADYKVLYAFSDFVHPLTNAAISEHAINELKEGEQIEDRFEGEDYRLMVVANKFQTGFDQPLLAGMFLDKPVFDRNAVQTISRLNRCYDEKRDVVVVDFTNNAKAIIKAFATYRKGTPFEPGD